MLKRRRHPVQDAAIHFDGSAADIQANLLARLLRGLAHHSVKALGDAFELDHARTQQIPL